MSVTAVLVAIVALGFMIVVHEGGHFLVARLCGMRVERFSIGFGNPLVSVKRGDTIYQIAPIPLGGFVQITGLNPHEEFDHNDPFVYPNRPRWMRLAVLVAGPAANYVTAGFLALGILLGYGAPSPAQTNTIDQVKEGTPAHKAGLRKGDVLRQANNTVLNENLGVSSVIKESKGQPVTLKVLRDGQPTTITLVPELDKPSGDYRIGIMLMVRREPVPFLTALHDSAVMPIKISGLILRSFGDMITRKQKAELNGPLGIVQTLAETARQGGLDFLMLVLQLSTYLGLFNLLPLPALDGGRVLFLGINALRSKDLNAKTEATVHMVGLVVLLGVFVLVTFSDIHRLVSKLFTHA
jgi:regulator of sigma E protease